MAFTIKPDGTITVDTADEMRAVLAVRQQQQAAAVAASAMEPVPERPQAPEALGPAQLRGYRAVYELMADQRQQQNLLRVLYRKAPVGMTDDELRIALALPSNLELRGLLIGIVRRAKNKGLESPIRKEMTRTDGGRKRRYRYTVTGAFRDAMEGYRFDGPLLESA